MVLFSLFFLSSQCSCIAEVYMFSLPSAQSEFLMGPCKALTLHSARYRRCTLAWFLIITHSTLINCAHLSCVVLWNIHGDLCLRFSYGCYLTQVTMSTDEPGFQLIQILPFLGWLTCLLRGYYFFSDHTQAQCFTASQY